jgi:hypothetical protein
MPRKSTSEIYQRGSATHVSPASPDLLPVSSLPSSAHIRIGAKMTSHGQETDLLAKIGEASVQVLGLLSLVLVSTWSVYFRGGLAWITENKALIFNVSST